MKFAIITYILHKEHKNAYYSYEPYIREMKLWLKYVKKVEIVAPAPPPPKGEPITGEAYQHSNLVFTPIPSFDVLSFDSIFKTFFKIPWIFFRILGSMQRAEHIHLRCPGNIGLIACIAQIFFPLKPKTVKYAGNWDPNSKQPWSYRLQKRILSNTFLSRNIKVLVYGEWPKQSKNILPFFTASFSETERIKIERDFTSPFKFIFVGSLSAGKRPFLAIKIVEALMAKGIPAKLEIYGNGVMKNELQEYINTNNLEPFVKLMGSVKLEELKEVYKTSHFLILASQSEGWPKAVAEAMFFGCIPITTPVSCVSWMLAPPAPEGGAQVPIAPEGGDRMVTITERGVLVPPVPKEIAKEAEWLEETTGKIIELINNPEEMERMSLAGQDWSQEYTLEKFEAAIKKVLATQPPKGE